MLSRLGSVEITTRENRQNGVVCLNLELNHYFRTTLVSSDSS